MIVVHLVHPYFALRYGLCGFLSTPIKRSPDDLNPVRAEAKLLVQLAQFNVFLTLTSSPILLHDDVVACLHVKSSYVI